VANLNLKSALAKCIKYADNGYALAMEGVAELQQVTAEAKSKISEQIAALDSSVVKERSSRDALASQLSEITANFATLPIRLETDINALSKSVFSIALFGRTMAGKSTLMEILTNGNGQSIGKGGQRTTRDVRGYDWNGLHITDVPGVAAFEGQEDEEVAFKAAKSSDLILFLITDDAPQAAEAECMIRIRNLGKPVICLINVKASIESPSTIKMFKKDLDKKFDSKHLAGIKNQFCEFGERKEQNWRDLKFIYVHLRSEFLSRQPEFSDCAKELHSLSRISDLESFIADKIITNGKFYKLKAFVDAVSVPLIDTMDWLLNQSAQNIKQGRIVSEKRHKLISWSDSFKKDCATSIEALCSKITAQLKHEVAAFAEDNYDNQNASKEWEEILKKKRIQDQCESLIKEFSDQCNKEVEEIRRAIGSESKYQQQLFTDSAINMSRIVDGKRIWGWAIAGGTILASILTGGVGALVVAAVGWLGSLFFDTKAKKQAEARQRLESALNENINKTIETLRKNMLDYLSKTLLNGTLYPLNGKLDDFASSLLCLSGIQFQLSIRLHGKIRDENRALVCEALNHLGFNKKFRRRRGISRLMCGFLKHFGFKVFEWRINDIKDIKEIARVPGNALMWVLEPGKTIPDEVREELSALLNERVWFMFYESDLKSTLVQAIGDGCDHNNINIENIDDKPRIAHVNSSNSFSKIRIKLAQQLTELLIMKSQAESISKED
jgi:GTP-binding protein EngB required for normal cell division